MSNGVFVLFEGWLLVLLQAVLSAYDRFLTVPQMQRHHCPQGIPFLWHFGICWGDTFIIVPLCAAMAEYYGSQWHVKDVAYVGAVAFVLSGVMHWQYLACPTQHSHMDDKRITPAAYVHFVFMWVALTIIGLFFLYTTGVPAGRVISAAYLLWAHVVIGTHLFLKLWPPSWFPEPPIDSITLLVWVGAAFGLGGLAWFALV